MSEGNAANAKLRVRTASEVQAAMERAQTRTAINAAWIIGGVVWIVMLYLVIHHAAYSGCLGQPPWFMWLPKSQMLCLG